MPSELLAFLQGGTPLLLLLLIIANVWTLFSIQNMKDNINVMLKNMVWQNECKLIQKNLNDRIESVKEHVNMSGKQSGG